MKRIPSLLCAIVLGCTTRAPSPRVETTLPDSAAGPEASEPAPARLSPQPLSRYVPSAGFRDLGDGRSGAVVSERRILIDKAKATVVDPRPVDDLGRGHRIPRALGGGFVFIGAHTVRFAPGFAGPLTTIAVLPVRKDAEVEIGFGHAQILVHAPPDPPALYALPSGRELPLPVPGTVQMFGTRQGLVALVTNRGELYATSAKGAAFERLKDSGVQRLAFDGKGIVVGSRDAQERLDFAGHLAIREDEPGMIVADNVDAWLEPWPDFSRPPMQSDVDRLVDPLVVSLGADAALLVKEQNLLVLDAHTGKLVAERKQAFAGESNCFPIRGGAPAFVGCNGDGFEMALYRIDAADKPPVLERKFQGVYTHTFGEPQPDAPLALAKRCDGSDAPGVFCVRQADGQWRELPKVTDPERLLARLPFVVTVAASSDGAAYAFGWLDGAGDLVVIDSRQKKVRRIPRSGWPKWASEGIRWHALTIVDGQLRFLIGADESRSAGVLEIRADDTVDTKLMKGRMAAYGRRGLLITSEGAMMETLDAGLSFHDVPAPPGGAPDRGVFVCMETGCTIGPWERVGWGPD